MMMCMVLATLYIIDNEPKSARGAVEGVEVNLPIIMYHNILNSKTGKYVVSEAQLESDFIALLERGFTPVFLSQVIDWVDGIGTLPKKPIVITFDDGHYNNLHYALPLAKKHNIKFMINPVTSFSAFTERMNDHSKPSYSHITFKQMKEAQDTGHIEFGNHTHAMHKFKPRFGIMPVSGECSYEYSKKLKSDIQKAQKLLTDSGVNKPKTFAYPFGKFSRDSRNMLLDLGFRALLTCTEKTNTIKKGEPKTLHQLGRFNRDGSYTTEEFIALFCK